MGQVGSGGEIGGGDLGLSNEEGCCRIQSATGPWTWPSAWSERGDISERRRQPVSFFFALSIRTNERNCDVDIVRRHDRHARIRLYCDLL